MTAQNIARRGIIGIVGGIVATIAIAFGNYGIAHAQTEGPAYVVTELEVSNQKGYMQEFIPLLQPILKKYGGKVIAFGKPEMVGGHPEKTVSAIIAFDSMEKATAWYNSKEYAEAGKIRDKYAKLVSYILKGRPQ